MFLLLFLVVRVPVVRVPIEYSADASHQNRSLGDEQLDDSIVDTLVCISADQYVEFLQI